MELLKKIVPIIIKIPIIYGILKIIINFIIRSRFFYHITFNIALIESMQQLTINPSDYCGERPNLHYITIEINKKFKPKPEFKENYINYKLNQLIDKGMIESGNIVLGKMNTPNYYCRKYPVRYKVFRRIYQILKIFKFIKIRSD